MSAGTNCAVSEVEWYEKKRMEKPQCANCRWQYRRPNTVTTDSRPDTGTVTHTKIFAPVCRRHPPIYVIVNGAGGAEWPQVNDDDWCGEWEFDTRDFNRRKE